MKYALKTMMVMFVFAFSAVLFAAEEKKAYSEADYKVAYDLLEAANLKGQLDGSINFMIDMQVKMMAQLEPVRKELISYYDKLIGYEALKKPMAEMYLDMYTVSELKDLTNFYKSPIGKKVAENGSTMLIKQNEMMTSALMENQKGLEEIYMKAFAEGLDGVELEEGEVIIEE